MIWHSTNTKKPCKVNYGTFPYPPYQNWHVSITDLKTYTHTQNINNFLGQPNLLLTKGLGTYHLNLWIFLFVKQQIMLFTKAICSKLETMKEHI